MSRRGIGTRSWNTAFVSLSLVLACGVAVVLWPSVATADGAVAGGAEKGLGLLRFVGRTHPVLVHFPIAMLFGAALCECLALLRRRPVPSEAGTACLVIGAAGAVAASASGWLNAWLESHAAGQAGTVMAHRWLGTGVAALAVLLVVVHARHRHIEHAPRVWRLTRLAGLVVAAGLVGLAGHLGGSLVYGENYLFEAFGGAKPTRQVGAAGAATETPPPDAIISYSRHVQPILNARCVECHGPNKVKGNLRLDTAGGIFHTERGCWVVRPGDADGSELLRRVQLPFDDDEFMPSEQDPLTDSQIDTLKRWIEQGARTEEPAGG